MKYSMLIIILIIALSLAGCNKAADISSPNHYNKHNIQLSYPGNWEITEEESDDNFTYLALEGGDAMFIIQVYAKEETVPLEEFVSIFSETTKEALPFGDIVDISFSKTEKKIMSGKRIGTKELFSVKLLGQKVPHIREYYAVDSGEKTLFIISHIPTENLPQAAPGFKLIQDTLKVLQ